jgi:hypothetical protein
LRPLYSICLDWADLKRNKIVLSIFPVGKPWDDIVHCQDILHKDTLDRIIDCPRLSCRRLVRHSASFLSPLMQPPPRHPILDRERRSRCLLPRIRPTPAPTPTRALAIARPRGRFTSCAHHRRTSRLSFWPSACSFSPTYCPRPRSQPRVDRRSSTWVRGESVLLLAFLRVCSRGGHGGACHA